MDANSSSADPNQASSSRYHGSFSLSNEQWEALNLPLADTLQISLTQCIYFNAFSEPNATPHILISSLEVSTISTNLKFEVWKYFDKVIVDGVRRVQYKLCQNVSYAFPKNARTEPLSRHIWSKYPEHRSRQTQIGILGDTLGTFTYNRFIDKTNLGKYLTVWTTF